MKFQRRRSPDATVDLTPLIDVVFLLLIFFMVTTTFVREGRMSLELPEAGTEVQIQPAEPLQVIVGTDGGYSVNGRVLTDRSVETVMTALREASGEDLSLPVVITADGRAPHQSVVTVIDAAERIGLTSVRIAIQPERGPPP